MMPLPQRSRNQPSTTSAQGLETLSVRLIISYMTTSYSLLDFLGHDNSLPSGELIERDGEHVVESDGRVEEVDVEGGDDDENPEGHQANHNGSDNGSDDGSDNGSDNGSDDGSGNGSDNDNGMDGNYNANANRVSFLALYLVFS